MANQYVDIPVPGLNTRQDYYDKYPRHQVGEICYYNGKGGRRFYLITKRTEISIHHNGVTTFQEPMLELRLLMNEDMMVTHPSANKPKLEKRASFMHVVSMADYLDYQKKLIEAISDTAESFRERYL